MATNCIRFVTYIKTVNKDNDNNKDYTFSSAPYAPSATLTGLRVEPATSGLRSERFLALDKF